jgi:hypothetical protein
MSKKISAALCVSIIIFVNTQVGRAALIANMTKIKDPSAGDPFLAPDSPLPAPWVSYRLSVETTSPGELIGAVDVAVTGNKLHQRWEDVDFDGAVDPSPQNPNASDGRGDSHLTAPAGSPFGLGPTETNTGAGSPLTDIPSFRKYGVGDLVGAWALLAAPTSTNIAYLVFKGNDPPVITIKSANPAGVRYNDIVIVPEPTALALLSTALIGGVSFVRRRA